MPRIPLYAHAECIDGPCGDLSGLVVRADSRALEYFVVQDTTPGHAIERLVPRDRVDATREDTVHLACTLAELTKLRALNVQELQADAPRGTGSPASYGRTGGLNLVDSERAPDGTGVLRKGQQVEATDAKVGKLCGAVVDDEARITHFYTQLARHESSELELPVTALDYVDRYAVYLRLDKHQLESLPAQPRTTDHDKQTSLLAKVYATPDGAAEALDELRQAQANGQQPISIREAAVFSRQGDAAVRVDQQAHSDTGKGATMGVAAGGVLAALGPVGLLAGAVAGGAVGAFIGSRSEHGLASPFIEAVQRRIQPDHSALVLLIEHDPGQDVQKAHSVLQGAMSQEALIDQAVEDMLAKPAT